MTLTGNTTDGQTLVTNITTSSLATGMLVTGTGIQSGSTVQYIVNSSSFILSQAALLTQTGVNLTFTTLVDQPVTATVVFNGSNSNLTQASSSGANSTRLQSFGTIVWNIVNSNLSGKYNLTSSYPQVSTVQFNVSSSLTQVASGLSFTDVVDEILLLWGMLAPGAAPVSLLKDTVHIVNGALQDIWSVSKETPYFARSTLPITFNSGISTSTLPINVLAVVGPIRLNNGQVLRMFDARDQFDNFGPIYLGQTSFIVAGGNPIAAFVEQLNIAASDNVTNIIHIVPTPTGTTTVNVDVTLQPPRFQFSDYLNHTQIQMPNLYADAILIPFVRYKAMNSIYFTKSERAAIIVAEYQGALKLLGAVDPQAKEVEFTSRSSGRGN